MVTPSLMITLSEVSFSQLPYCAWILPKAWEESVDINKCVIFTCDVPLLHGVDWFLQSGAHI